MSIRLIVSGAQGRMGILVRDVAASDPRFEVVQLLEAKGHPDLGRSVMLASGGPSLRIEDTVSAEADVLVDFTTPEGFRQRVAECVQAKIAFVSGTTGLSTKDRDLLVDASSLIPALHAPNMSMGVDALCRAAAFLATSLPEDFDVEVTEVHHRRKVDAPSGTAKRLFEVLRKARPSGIREEPVAGRRGPAGPRGKEEIGVHALRGGDVVGEHTVWFLGDGERLEIAHRCWDRRIFARGALRAAARLVSASPGLYDLAALMAGSSGGSETKKSL